MKRLMFAITVSMFFLSTASNASADENRYVVVGHEANKIMASGNIYHTECEWIDESHVCTSMVARKFIWDCQFDNDTRGKDIDITCYRLGNEDED